MWLGVGTYVCIKPTSLHQSRLAFFVIELPEGSHEAPGRPPQDPQMAHMRHQDVPRGPPGDTREACVFLALRGDLAEHIPN